MNIPRTNKYLKTTYRRVTIQEPEAFAVGPLIISSRYLMGLLVEHVNRTSQRDKPLTIEDFRIKKIANENSQPEDAAETEDA